MPTRAHTLKPRKAPVQRRAVETRARILDAAARVFSAHGYSAGTTNRIAAAADLSVGSLYQYFPNKDAILVELVRRHVAEGTQVLMDRLGELPVDVDVATRLGVVVDAMIANHVDDPALHQVLFEEAPRPPELLAELHALERTVVAAVAALLRADPAVHVDDTVLVAHLLVTTVESVVHRTIATRERTVDVDRFRDELLVMLTRYLGRSGGVC